MNIQQALDRTDEMKPNMMKRDLKIAYLKELDQMIYREILLKHEHTEEQEVLPEYNGDSDPGTELLVPDPYSKIYPFWLMAHIDLQNLEYEKYNNNMLLFDNAYREMQDWWTRTYMPLSRNRQLWI